MGRVGVRCAVHPALPYATIKIYKFNTAKSAVEDRVAALECPVTTTARAVSSASEGFASQVVRHWATQSLKSWVFNIPNRNCWH